MIKKKRFGKFLLCVWHCSWNLLYSFYQLRNFDNWIMRTLKCILHAQYDELSCFSHLLFHSIAAGKEELYRKNECDARRTVFSNLPLNLQSSTAISSINPTKCHIWRVNAERQLNFDMHNVHSCFYLANTKIRLMCFFCCSSTMQWFAFGSRFQDEQKIKIHIKRPSELILNLNSNQNSVRIDVATIVDRLVVHLNSFHF